MPTALITGASRGIGKAAAHLFANSGWDLLLVSRSEETLGLLAKDLECFSRSISYQSVDLSDPHSIPAAIEALIKQGGAPDVLINNAGVAWTGDLLTMPLQDWQWLIQMNLTSVFQICSIVVPYMRDKGGLVINVSSHAANNAFPQWGAYCVSKAALASFTKCLAEEERKNSIRACTLTLGAVNSSLWDTATVHGNFDRESMLSVEQVAETLLRMAEQSSSQVVEDLILMPASGAF